MTALGIILTKKKFIVFLIHLNKTGKETLTPATCPVTLKILLKKVKIKYLGFWLFFKVKISRCLGNNEFNLVSCVLRKNNKFTLSAQLSYAVTNYL